MSREDVGPMVKDVLSAERGDDAMVVSGSMEKEFGANDEEVVVDSKEDDQVAMEEEGETITAPVKHQGTLREVVAEETQSEEYEFPGESGDEAVDGIETMTIEYVSKGEEVLVKSKDIINYSSCLLLIFQYHGVVL